MCIFLCYLMIPPMKNEHKKLCRAEKIWLSSDFSAIRRFLTFRNGPSPLKQSTLVPQLSQLFRMINDLRGTGSLQFFCASEAPAHAETGDPGVFRCPYIYLRVTDVDRFFPGKTELFPDCIDCVREGLAADACPIPAGYVKHTGEIRGAELLHGVIRFVGDHGEAAAPFFETDQCFRKPPVGSRLLFAMLRIIASEKGKDLLRDFG